MIRPLIVLLALSVPAWAGDPAQYNLVQSAQSIANAGSYVGSITLQDTACLILGSGECAAPNRLPVNQKPD